MPGAPSSTGRHSILDLAPLELDCMNALWPIGEATVRDIQLVLQPTTPRAYTTIMTILDRLAQKGIVLRRKSGRAWVYRANLTAEEARSHALEQLVNGFFAGSSEGLAQHLAGRQIGIDSGRSALAGSNPQLRPPKPSPQPHQAALRDPEKTATPDLDASLL